MSEKKNTVFKMIFIMVALFIGFLPTKGQASPSISRCTENADDGGSDETDIRAVMWNINDDWSNFESEVEWRSGKNLRESLHNDFSNGTVMCEYDSPIYTLCGLLGGSSEFVPLGRADLCGDFLEGLHDEAQKDRRACYAAILAKTFANSNGKTPSASELIGEAAFAYWEDRFGSTIDFDDCNI